MIKIFLDDERPTPKGWTRTYTVEETIALIQANDGNVAAVSLDNDLGDGLDEGWNVALWIEEQAHFGSIQPIHVLNVHSSNSARRDYMMAAFKSTQRFWPSSIITSADFHLLDVESLNETKYVSIINTLVDNQTYIADLGGNTTKAQRKHLRPLAVQQYPNTKRNESCPCGSGKKYKKCCQ